MTLVDISQSWQRKLDPDLNIMDTLHTLLFKSEWASSLSYTIDGLMGPWTILLGSSPLYASPLSLRIENLRTWRLRVETLALGSFSASNRNRSTFRIVKKTGWRRMMAYGSRSVELRMYMWTRRSRNIQYEREEHQFYRGYGSVTEARALLCFASIRQYYDIFGPKHRRVWIAPAHLQFSQEDTSHLVTESQLTGRANPNPEPWTLNPKP